MKIADSAGGNDDRVALDATLFTQFEVHSSRILTNIDEKNLVLNTTEMDLSHGSANNSEQNTTHRILFVNNSESSAAILLPSQ